MEINIKTKTPAVLTEYLSELSRSASVKFVTTDSL